MTESQEANMADSVEDLKSGAGSRKKLILALLALLGLAAGLALPISNYFLVREKIEVKSDDPRFAEVSKIMQTSCVDCHTQGMTTYPLYFSLPVAKEIIQKDIKQAQSAFLLSRAQLSGAEKIGSINLAKIATVIGDGSMPPAKYTLLHWNAVLSAEQKQTVLAYIQERQDDSGVALAAIPEQNPFHPDAKKAALGEKLYFDKRLSGDNTVSCASCHGLDKGGCDREVVSTGIKGRKGSVNSPTVFNSAFNFCQFWDGRAKDLAEQAAGPLNNPKEMGSNFPQVLAKLHDDAAYGALSKAAYGGPLDQERIKDAIATYEKTLITPHCAFDRYLQGDSAALNDEQKRGYQLFMEKGCASCHAGVAMGGMSFEKMGTSKDYFAYREKNLHLPYTEADNGRFNVTKDPLDKGKFKVPILRNIELTAPYFHDGSAKTLTEAVDVMAEYQTGSKLEPRETEAIVAFLKTLTGEYRGKKLQ